MGFVLDGLDTEDYDRSYSDRELLARIVSYFRPYGRQIVVIGAAIALNSLAGTGGPILISYGVDLVARDPSTPTLLLLAGGVLLLGGLAWLFNFVQQALSARVVGDVVLRVREDVFEAVIRNDLSFYDEHPSGKIVSRVTSDTQAFSQVVALSTELLSQVLLVVLLIGYLFSVNARLTLVLLAVAPVVVGVALGFRTIARRTVTQSRRVLAEVSAHIQETVSGIGVAKSFRQERTIYDEFLDVNAQSYRINLRTGYVFVSIFPLLSIISAIGTAAIVYFAGLSARGGSLSTGDWYLFVQGMAMFWYPLTSIASFWSQFQDGLSAAERAFALIDARPKVVQEGSEPVGRLRGHIEFRNLRFAYTATEEVLPDFCLDIRPGETVALVGHTGAGKSSVARLIGRFYEFQGGELRIDGHDIRRLDLDAYRRQVGVVPQEPFLFSGTVRDNIRYGDPDASDEQVWAVAQRISSGEWLGALPHGLDTDVGERGANLSMGQRQLVALARVMLKDPAVLILDEATASVDPFTETQIQEGLEALMRDRTAIIIAHRLSTVRNADRILVMDRGRIVEEGSHDELLARGGHYADLYNTYFRHQSMEYVERFVEVVGESS